MNKMQLKCVIILSCKSSGSTALLNFLTKIKGVNTIKWTRHYENETLYWTKAASVLGLKQTAMLDSEVPIPKDNAIEELKCFLDRNLDVYSPPKDNTELIFDGWKKLCQQYGPVFVEKSPHHLHQWAALELLIDCINRYPEIDFKIIGLVRNPQAMLYSSWKRWKSIPEKNQFEWYTAQDNLLKLRDILKNNLLIIRYEDMVSDSNVQEKILRFVDLKGNQDSKGYLHKRSISKWNKDPLYGFQIHSDVVKLAEQYGYDIDVMKNNYNMLWTGVKYLAKIKYKITKNH